MSDCLFCKFVNKEIETEVVFENENVMAFKDLYPQAKKHFLFIHKMHTTHINELTEQDPEQLTHIFTAIQEFTQSNNLGRDGFRIVNNCGSHGGQTIFTLIFMS